MAHKTQDTKFSRHKSQDGGTGSLPARTRRKQETGNGNRLVSHDKTMESARFLPGHAGNGKRETRIGSFPTTRRWNRLVSGPDTRETGNGKRETGIGSFPVTRRWNRLVSRPDAGNGKRLVFSDKMVESARFPPGHAGNGKRETARFQRQDDGNGSFPAQTRGKRETGNGSLPATRRWNRLVSRPDTRETGNGNRLDSQPRTRESVHLPP